MISDTGKTKSIRKRKQAKKGRRRKKAQLKRGSINYLTAKELPIEQS